jgi:hypothetical protein
LPLHKAIGKYFIAAQDSRLTSSIIYLSATFGNKEEESIMELIIIYLITKIKTKTAEINYSGNKYIILMVMLWLIGELLGFVIGSKLTASGGLIYLITASCGVGAGLLVYRKAMSLEPQHPDYFDLRQSKSDSYREEEAAPATQRSDMVEVLKERKQQIAEPATPDPATPVKTIVNEERKPDYKPEIKFENKSESNIGFRDQVEVRNGRSTATNNNIFQFPYNELLSINELVIGEYGSQTVQDGSIAEFQWFESFKAKYESREVKAALTILEKAISEDRNNGLIWLLFGVLYKDAHHDFDKALQFCLTGAKRCNTYKTALLTEAAELLLLGKKDVLNAFKFFCLAIIVITDGSKAWGNPNANGCIAQERAFHFVRVLLTAFNFTDYRLYLERNIHFSTGMDQTLIENVLALCAESSFHAEIEQLISQMFPLIIEKLQSMA